ncbi:hypothetical protein C0J52_02928 [Blattella germanica]|nr:hypothetical protein C0J52_02928 [Blattella germanica]
MDTTCNLTCSRDQTGSTLNFKSQFEEVPDHSGLKLGKNFIVAIAGVLAIGGAYPTSSFEDFSTKSSRPFRLRNFIVLFTYVYKTGITYFSHSEAVEHQEKYAKTL